MAVSKEKYYKNLTAAPVRILNYQVKPAGVVAIPVEEARGPKFAPSVGVLIEEITPEEYDKWVTRESSNREVIARRDKPTVLTYVQVDTPRGGKVQKEIHEDVIVDLHPKENERLREVLRRENDDLRRKISAAQSGNVEAVEVSDELRRNIPASEFAGAEWATSSREDPAAGKTLTQVRVEEVESAVNRRIEIGNEMSEKAHRSALDAI